MRSSPARGSLVLVALLAVACGSGDGTTTEPTPMASPTATASPDRTPGDLREEAIAAFQAWVAALAEGESQRAWDLMAPSSRDALGSFDQFEQMRTGFAEGWGSWVAVEDPRYAIEEDDAERTLLVADCVIRPEGQEERREVGVPITHVDGELMVSPFEEFGNVARGLAEASAGEEAPGVPSGSGEGRRVVYANGDQRVWLVDDDGSVVASYLVSGRRGVPDPGTYEVFSKSETAFAGHDDITMRHMVRFAHGENLAIGFHAIPNDGNGRPIQSEEELGEFHSAGCVRQSPGHAAALYEWADVGTTVVVLA